MLLAVECRLNRLSGILERIGAGLVPAASSPSLEGCALFDAVAYQPRRPTTFPACSKRLPSDNPWGKPGTVACQPGGEWDVRTRFARIVEALNVVTRLDYTYRANVAEGIVLVRFGRSRLSMLCRSANTMLKMTPGARWTRPKRAVMGHRARCAYGAYARGGVLCCGRSASRAATCRLRLPTASRASALSKRIPLAVRPIWPIAFLSPRILRAWTWTICRASVCSRRMRQTAPDTIEPAEVHARPRDDHRPLPPALRDLLLADTADELGGHGGGRRSVCRPCRRVARASQS